MAPNDLRMNQRLAALHTRAGRFAEAALCCRTLQRVYSEADHPDEATRYGELAERYEERTSIQVPGASADEAPVSLDAASSAGTLSRNQEAEPEVPEFSIEDASAEINAVEEEAPETAVIAPAASPWPTIAKHGPKAEPAEFAVADESTESPSGGPCNFLGNRSLFRVG